MFLNNQDVEYFSKMRPLSSVKVNWDKSKAVLVGLWENKEKTKLSGNLCWENAGRKVLCLMMHLIF